LANIQLRNVTKSYGSVTVIKGIDLEIRRGEFMVFVGPSGCGKSTLLRLVSGLESISRETSIRRGAVNNVIPPSGGSPWCSRAMRSTRT
jgi:multiple sugar transport system ATP-binding protein